MANMPIGNSISFDHTFKIASNIGYIREDKKWISEYDSAFLVLNDMGQLLTWQGTSFAEVTVLLQALAERPKDQLKTVYVDDCCKLRNKTCFTQCKELLKLFQKSMYMQCNVYKS